MRKLYPIMLDVSGRRCLIVGGGRVAARKARGLCEAGASVAMVASAFCPEAEQLVGVERLVSRYSPNCLGGAELVFACTDDPRTNAAVAADARAAGCWCNLADDPQGGDFLIPAVVSRGELQVAVGTTGQAPGLAAALARRLGSHLDERYGMLVIEVAHCRERVQALSPDRRAEVLDSACETASVDLLGRDADAWRRWFEGLCESP